MQTHTTLAQPIIPPVFFTLMEVKDTFIHVPIRRCLQKNLAFSFEGQFHFMTALPFGSKTAPYVWDRIMSVPIPLLYEQKITYAWYLDDVLIWSSYREQAISDFRSSQAPGI